jgi:DUF971 family protein
MAEQIAYPSEIQRDDGGQMRILWNDGHECHYTYEQLRKACPCATCRESKTQQQADPFNIIDVSATARLTPTHISTVGHYALNIEWSDGHHTGIYPWSLLRDLCESSGGN